MNVQNQPPLPRAPHPRPALTQLVPPFAARPTADRVWLVAAHGGAGCTTIRMSARDRYADAGRLVRKVAVGGGACGDYEEYAIAAGCDTFVTSDLTYHTFLDAPGKGINLMDAGHFPTEDPVCARLVAYLKEQVPQRTVMKSASHREVIQYSVEGE